MSVNILKGSLETIALMHFLRTDKFITSSRIRQNFKSTFSGTLYMRLQKLTQQGIVEKKTKKGNFAGDDRTEYKLTEKGKNLLKELLNYNLEFLNSIINKIIEQKISDLEKLKIKDKENKVRDFLVEFSEESVDLVDNDTMKQLHQILEKLINIYL